HGSACAGARPRPAARRFPPGCRRMNQRLRKAAARKPPKAERRRVRLLDRLSTWRDLHLYSLVSSFGRIAQRPWASGLTVGVMAVALALPLCLALLMGNLQRFGGAVET